MSIYAIGSKSDAAAVSDSGAFSLIALVKRAIGKIRGITSFSATLTLDTAVYSSGAVLSATAWVADAFVTAGGMLKLESLVVLDKDAQGIDFDLVLFRNNVSIGAVNTPVTITDVGAESILGIISVKAADFVDLGGSKVATLRNIGLVLKGNTGVQSLYAATISRGAGTYSADGLRLLFGFSDAL